jgi:lysophospholipase L1-like esterase
VTLVHRYLARALLAVAGIAVAQSSPAPEQAGSLAAVRPSPEVAPGAMSPAAGGDDPSTPVFSQRILRLRARAQERILGRDQGIEDEFRRVVPAEQIVLPGQREPDEVNGNALGRFVPVENEAALGHFHGALAALESSPAQKNKVRIAVYGASHTQADIYSGYLRYYLQSRFGNGGPGFLPIGFERGWYKRSDFKVRTKGLKVQYVQTKSAPPHGRFGLSGSSAVAGPNASVKFWPDNNTDPDLAASQYGLFYAAEPEGGKLAIRVDGVASEAIDTRAAAPEARYYTFERPVGWHRVELRSIGQGGARLFGLSVERAQPGLVVDTLGIRGTRAASMLHWDRALWEEHLRRRSPDLVLLAYGTNETTDKGQPIDEYVTELGEVLSRLRQALPAMSCVLVGPGDFPKAQGTGWATRPRLLEIIAAQRRLAPQHGCAFWNTYEFMGGAGSMDAWVKANPRLGSPDHIHLTPRGYVRMGMALADALMRSYDSKHLAPDERFASQPGGAPLPSRGAASPSGKGPL